MIICKTTKGLFIHREFELYVDNFDITEASKLKYYRRKYLHTSNRGIPNIKMDIDCLVQQYNDRERYSKKEITCHLYILRTKYRIANSKPCPDIIEQKYLEKLEKEEFFELLE